MPRWLVWLLVVSLPWAIWAQEGDAIPSGLKVGEVLEKMAQGDASPSGLKVGEILEKMAQADGSRLAKGTLKTLKVNYAIEMLAMGMTMKVTAMATPNSALLITEMNGSEMGRQGFDGKEAWSSDMMLGLRVLEGSERLSMEQMTLKGILDLSSLYDEVVLGEATTFNGKSAVELVARKGGVPDTHIFIDRTTWLTIGTKSIQVSPHGEMPVTMTVERYRKLKSGLMFSEVVSIEAGPVKMKMVVKELKENAELDGISFSKPGAEGGVP